MDQSGDVSLVILLQQDEVEAFDPLYWKYHQLIYANILKLVKDTEATKDLLQEVFVTLWEKRLTIDANKPVANWLFVVSYNKSVSYLKKSLKESLIATELHAQVPAFDQPWVNMKEGQLQLLEEAIGQLPPQRKRVFELCKLQGKTYEECAKELNISKHTVKEYLSAAIATIQAYIKAHPTLPLHVLHIILLSSSVLE